MWKSVGMSLTSFMSLISFIILVLPSLTLLYEHQEYLRLVETAYFWDESQKQMRYDKK